MSRFHPDDWKLDGEAKASPAQLRMLNAVCDDLARQLHWHGHRLDKDSWRHLFSGTMLGWKLLPAIDMGDGRTGFIMLGGSSLRLNRSECADAITLAVKIGDDPASQRMTANPVQWSDAVLHGLGYSASDTGLFVPSRLRGYR